MRRVHRLVRPWLLGITLVTATPGAGSGQPCATVAPADPQEPVDVAVCMRTPPPVAIGTLSVELGFDPGGLAPRCLDPPAVPCEIEVLPGPVVPLDALVVGRGPESGAAALVLVTWVFGTPLDAGTGTLATVPFDPVGAGSRDVSIASVVGTALGGEIPPESLPVIELPEPPRARLAAAALALVAGIARVRRRVPPP